MPFDGGNLKTVSIQTNEYGVQRWNPNLKNIKRVLQSGWSKGNTTPANLHHYTQKQEDKANFHCRYLERFRYHSDNRERPQQWQPQRRRSFTGNIKWWWILGRLLHPPEERVLCDDVRCKKTHTRVYVVKYQILLSVPWSWTIHHTTFVSTGETKTQKGPLPLFFSIFYLDLVPPFFSKPENHTSNFKITHTRKTITRDNAARHSSRWTTTVLQKTMVSVSRFWPLAIQV